MKVDTDGLSEEDVCRLNLITRNLQVCCSYDLLLHILELKKMIYYLEDSRSSGLFRFIMDNDRFIFIMYFRRCWVWRKLQNS